MGQLDKFTESLHYDFEVTFYRVGYIRLESVSCRNYVELLRLQV